MCMEEKGGRSIFDEYELNKDSFEGVIGVGMGLRQVLTIFRKSEEEMNAWCGEQYGIPSFKTTYDIIRQMSLAEYMDAVKVLGERGNPSALNIMNAALQSLTQQTVRITFEGGSMRPVGEEDREDED